MLSIPPSNTTPRHPPWRRLPRPLVAMIPLPAAAIPIPAAAAVPVPIPVPAILPRRLPVPRGPTPWGPNPVTLKAAAAAAAVPVPIPAAVFNTTTPGGTPVIGAPGGVSRGGGGVRGPHTEGEGVSEAGGQGCACTLGSTLRARKRAGELAAQLDRACLALWGRRAMLGAESARQHMAAGSAEESHDWPPKLPSSCLAAAQPPPPAHVWASY